MRRLPTAMLGLLLLAAPAPATATEPDAVVLLHGMGRGPWAMKLLGHRLDEAGYEVHNLSYPRRNGSLDELVVEVHRQYRVCCAEGAREVHFVTHSLGGLVARAYLAEHRPANVGRVVMLAPPNGGSEIVDRLGGAWWFRMILGPMAPQLGTGDDALPKRLAVPRDAEVGVIAGDRWLNPAGPLALPGPHDGTVSVAATRLPGMRDHLVVPTTHTFIMNSKQVAREVVHFLRHGRFERADDPT